MKQRLITALCVLSVGCSSAAAPDTSETTEEMLSSEASPHAFSDLATSRPSQPSSGPLVDHGGRVLPTTTVRPIWWGPAASFPSDAKAGIAALFNGMAGTSFLGVSTQYMRGAASTVTLGADLSDPSSPPSRSPSTTAIVNEACKVINSNGQVADPTAVYFVFASSFPSGHVSYCAWHSYGTCNGVTVQVAYMPNVTGVSGCNPLGVTDLGCNAYSQGTVALANVTSHEFMEAITDADISAWYDSSGAEDGDKCAWRFQSCVALTNSSWQLQEEWSNAANGCVQQ